MIKPAHKVAVVVGGGGLKPFAAVPLFEFLKKMDIPIDLLVGCSGGSILSALHAMGFSGDEIIEKFVPLIRKSLFRKNWRAVLALSSLPFGKLDRTSALLLQKPVLEFAKSVFGNRQLEDLSPKTVFQVTDFQTGEGMGLERGNLATCVYASSAIFPFFPPVQINGRWLFDGVYSAPVPILQAVKRNADVIIVLDFLEKINENPSGVMDSMMHLSKLYAKTIMSNQMALSLNIHGAEIIYMKVKFEKYVSIWETDSFPVIFKAGHLALDRIKDDLLRAVGHNIPIKKHDEENTIRI